MAPLWNCGPIWHPQGSWRPRYVWTLCVPDARERRGDVRHTVSREQNRTVSAGEAVSMQVERWRAVSSCIKFSIWCRLNNICGAPGGPVCLCVSTGLESSSGWGGPWRTVLRRVGGRLTAMTAGLCGYRLHEIYCSRSAREDREVASAGPACRQRNSAVQSSAALLT